MKVAVLGTGIMGAGMARSLVRAGFDVTVWNRTPANAKPLAGDGAQVAATAADAVRGADAVVTVLFDADAVLAVLEPLAADLGDTPVIQASTIGLDGTRRVAELADAHGLRILDAPVLGTRQPAENGTLVCLVSGDPSTAERCRAVFDAIGARTMNVGTEPGRATALKLVVNGWVANLTSALGQSIALAEHLDLDPELFLDAIGGGPTDAPYAQVKGQSMIDGDYPTSFSVDGVVKDVGLIRAAAAEAGLRDDPLAATESLFGATAEAGSGDRDMAAVRTAFEPG